MSESFTAPKISLINSFVHWASATTSKLTSLEDQILNRYISFYPISDNSDEKRNAQILNVPIGKGNYIHELYIENDCTIEADDPRSKHVLIIHGFGASLGFFFRNFEDLSKLPNVKLHFIDLLGFGLSSRPKFPKFDASISQANDLKKCEDFFVDAIEAWRVSRKIVEFVLIGHSLGGFLSFVYSMKYPDHLVKLMLISPVGVERSIRSAQLNLSDSYIESQIKLEYEHHHLQESDLKNASDVPREFSGKEKTTSDDSSKEHPVERLHTRNGTVDKLSEGEQPKLPVTSKIVNYIWTNHILAPLSVVRFAGPLGSKFVSKWSQRRFSDSMNSAEEYLLLHKYVYFSIVGCKKSGECCITRLLGPGTLAYLPLIDRIPETAENTVTKKFHKTFYGPDKPKTILKNIPTFFVYGDRDWMNKTAGKAASDKLNEIHNQIYDGSKQISKYAVVENAGHHVYLDNNKAFLDCIESFLQDWLDI